MRTRCGLLGVMLVLGARAGAQTSAKPHADWEWGAEVELSYDDNVFLYSDADIAAFEAGASPDRFGFASVGDFCLTTELSAEKPVRRQGKSRTDLEAEVRSRLYLRDSEANQFRVRLGVQHLLDQRHWVRLKATYLPDYHVRRLYDRESATWAPAEFDYAALAVTYWQRFSREWAADVDLSWERRDYNRGFNERDANDWVGSVRARYSPDKRWDAWLGLDVRRSSARASDGLPGVDPDVSNTELSSTLGARCQLTPVDRVQAEWEGSRQRYTTGLQPAEDPYHSGRRDHESTVRLQYRRALDRDRALTLEWEHATSRSHLPAHPGTFPRDESLDYDRDRIGLSYSTQF